MKRVAFLAVLVGTSLVTTIASSTTCELGVQEPLEVGCVSVSPGSCPPGLRVVFTGNRLVAYDDTGHGLYDESFAATAPMK